MEHGYYLCGGNEEKRSVLVKEWLRRFEMMNGIEFDDEHHVDYDGKDYLCRMDYTEIKRKKRGGYSNRYVAFYENIDDLDLMKRNLDKEIKELKERNPNIIIIITAKYSMSKYPIWLNQIYLKYSFSEFNLDNKDLEIILSYLVVEKVISEPDIRRFKYKREKTEKRNLSFPTFSNSKFDTVRF